MEWRVLDDHFRAATSQKPAPFGEDAVEWDYSRYARALGLTGMPGMHDLPHTGVALVAAPPARWDDVRARYDEWAERDGWSVVTLSGHASVLAPDPVMHGLGRAVAGDGPIFFRSGRSGVPALGRRRRPEGCSLPLSSGERWLIASDRIRRRARTESALRGLVLFVEGAHKLTGAAMSTLAHFADAHRAWRERMLARDAKIYVVLATTPDRADAVLATLARFGIEGDVPVGRQSAPLRPPDLSLEEEQLVAALAAAPLALTESDVAAVFGLSARYLARALAERNILRARVEYGETCFVPHPAYGEDAGLPPPPQRVLDGIARRYRERKRQRQGHEHLPFALALLEARRGRPGRALAYMARTAHANAATVPYDMYEELVNSIATASPDEAEAPGAERVQEERAATDPGATEPQPPQCGVRSTHYATLCALHAHQRNYNQARAAAHRLTKRTIRNADEFHRVLVQILCSGRTHMDAYIPDGFWASLTVDGVDPALVDATCILAELFARLRLMPQDEVAQAFEVAMRSLHGANERERDTALGGLVAALVDRVRIHVQGLFPARHTHPPLFDPSDCCVPAYVYGTLIYGALGIQTISTGMFDETHRSTALELIRSTGCPVDSRIHYGGLLQLCLTRRHRLLTRLLADESVLLATSVKAQPMRRRLGLILQCMAGARFWRLSAARLVPASSNSEEGGDVVYEASALARALMYTGDFAGAKESLRAAFVGRVRMAPSIAHYVQSQVLLARKSLAWSEIREAYEVLERHRQILPAHIYSHARTFIDGSIRLCAGDFDAAERLFRESRELYGKLAVGLSDLRGTAGVSERCSRLLQQLRDGNRRDAASFNNVVRRAIRTVIANGGYGAGAHGRLLAVLDYAALGLEVWSRSDGSSAKDAAIGIALLFAKSTDMASRPIGATLVHGFATSAPTYFKLLKEALQERVGLANCPGSETRAIMTVLGHFRNAWADERYDMSSHEVGVLRHCANVSTARRVAEHISMWEEDASVYHALVHRAANQPSGQLLRVDTYGCFGIDRRAFHRLRLAWTVRQSAPATLDITPVRLEDAQRIATPTTRRVLGKTTSIRDDFLGESAEAEEVRRLIGIAAECRYPVLITGETGVGKDLVARSIHARSSVGQEELVVADCAAVADGVLESELFGHARGAFTGAVSEHSGYFDRADGSTMFLDEVDSMSRRMQATLLRVLETGEYRPVGGQETRTSDFRLISAAGPRLDDLMDKGEFRRDLYFRISTLRIHIPPLRARPRDVIVFGAAYAERRQIRITPEGLEQLAAYSWPGNVRQLRHCIDVASLEAHDKVVTRTMVVHAIDLASSTNTNDSKSRPGDSWGQVLELFMDGPFTAGDFARVVGVSRRSAQRHLGRLRRSGRIARVGAGRATQYQVRRDDPNMVL